MRDYEQLKKLLEDQETFPHRFIVKFIGKNGPRFATGIDVFEKRYPKLTLQSARTSAGDGHLAMTYALQADNADEIIEVLKAVAVIDDVLVIL